jgi:hypothetical protein
MGGPFVDGSAGLGLQWLCKSLMYSRISSRVYIVLQPILPQYPRTESRGNQGVICVADDSGDIWQ